MRLAEKAPNDPERARSTQLLPGNSPKAAKTADPSDRPLRRTQGSPSPKSQVGDCNDPPGLIWSPWPAGSKWRNRRLSLSLRPPLRMKPVPNGKPYRANRLWVLVDQLRTCDTLADACTATEKIRNP